MFGFMRFVGLVPGERSSGGKAARGGITKTGNPHLRRVVVEAAWHYQHRPHPSKTIQARRAGQPPAVVALAEQRLSRRFARLLARGKRPVIVATAVARELCGFLWAMMVHVPA
jgi:transposase